MSGLLLLTAAQEKVDAENERLLQEAMKPALENLMGTIVGWEREYEEGKPLKK